MLWLSYLSSLKMGGQRNLQRLVSAMDSSRVRSAVVTPEEGELADAMRAIGVPAIPLRLGDFELRRHGAGPRAALKTIEATRALRRVLEDREIDVVYADAPSHARYAWLAAQGLDTRVLWHAQTSIEDPVWDATLARSVDRIVAVSKAVARRFPDAPPERLEIIRNGVDTRRFDGEAKEGAREALFPGAPSDAVLVAYAGQISSEKGMDELVVVAGRLASEAPRVHFSLLGEGERVYVDALKEHAKRAGARVHFAGYTRELERVLPAADMLAFPSYGEGLPLAVVEAMASGLPVVAADAPGSNEVVDASVGRLVPVRRIDALANAIRELAADADLRRKLGAAARIKAVSEFSFERCAKEFERAFVDLANDAPRARWSRAAVLASRAAYEA